jgi:hypothetical protein
MKVNKNYNNLLIMCWNSQSFQVKAAFMINNDIWYYEYNLLG